MTYLKISDLKEGDLVETEDGVVFKVYFITEDKTGCMFINTKDNQFYTYFNSNLPNFEMADMEKIERNRIINKIKELEKRHKAYLAEKKPKETNGFATYGGVTSTTSTATSYYYDTSSTAA